jgi:multisubunit Na+/H+ antiporter MnhB subunit
MLGVCLVIGGSITVILYQITKRLNQQKVSRFLISVIIGLCSMNIGLIAPTIKGVIDKDGWAGMTKISFKC